MAQANESKEYSTTRDLLISQTSDACGQKKAGIKMVNVKGYLV